MSIQNQVPFRFVVTMIKQHHPHSPLHFRLLRTRYVSTSLLTSLLPATHGYITAPTYAGDLHVFDRARAHYGGRGGNHNNK